MIEWFARHSVAANLLMVSIVLGGLLTFKNDLVLEIFPDSAASVITVNVPLRSATPEDIELGIAVKIEEAVQDLEGIEEIVSTSREGSASVSIETDDENYDAREILAEVKSRVDSINTFPAEAEKPVISLAQRQFTVIEVTLFGPVANDELLAYAESVREELLQTPGISLASIRYAPNYEIAIEVSQDKLRDIGLTLGDIAGEIRNNSQDMSAGNVRTQGGDVLIRSKGQAYHRGDFEAIVVKTNSDGSIIRLRDVAIVKDAFEEDSIKSSLNGQNGLMVKVSRTGNESALDVAETVKQFINDKQDSLPAGISMAYWDDDSEKLKSRLGTLSSNMLQGGILVILLLTLFLRPAVAFWVFVGIPISFIGSFMVLSYIGISVNMMSLYGFILVLGLVVDDAIVTGESIYTAINEGGDGTEAVIRGTNRVAIPVTFGVLTTMAAFTPMLNLDGHMGTMFSPVPVVVISILFFSLIESKLVLPAHLKHLKAKPDLNQMSGLARWQKNFADGFERSILTYYKPLLANALKNRYSVLMGFIGLFLITVALLVKGWIPYTFFPRVPSETVSASLTMPIGTPGEVTEKYIRRIETAAEEIKSEYSDADGNSSVSNILSVVGSAGRGRGAATHAGRVAIETLPVSERPVEVDTAKLSREWRKKIGTISGAESLTFRAEMARFGDPIDIQLSGSSLAILGEVADLTKQQLAQYPGVFEIADTLSNGKEELRVDLTEQGHVLGLSRDSILRQVSEAFSGFEAQRIQRGRDDIRVLVRLSKDERRKTSTLEDFLIITPSGLSVPLSQVANITPAVGPAEIRRINRFRVVNVTADFDKKTTNAIALNNDLREFLDQLMANYPGLTYSLEGEAKDQRETTASMITSAGFLLFVIYCLLALPLRSYGQPLVIMSILPFGLIGAVLGHMIFGVSMALVSYLGLLALIGVMVNDSLVLVDFINQTMRRGATLDEAVVEAGAARFRAVMLTSLTTFFGLFPMMFASSTQSLFLLPMAISLGFGILFATTVTLFLVPCNMLIARDAKNKITGRNQRTDNLQGI